MKPCLFSRIQEERKKREISALAERIVALISQGDAKAFELAKDLLVRSLNGNVRLISRAYEVACLVAIKRHQERLDSQNCVEVLRPFADSLAFQASREAMEGKAIESFCLLRVAVKAGACREICKKVIRQILCQLSDEDRTCVIIYRRKGIVALDVGRLCQTGVIILGGNERYFLRDLGEVAEDQRLGRLKKERIANAPFSLNSMAWGTYFDELCADGDEARQRVRRVA